MSYNFTIDSIIEFVTALAALITIVILWNNRKSPEVKYLIYLQLFVAIWATMYAFEFGTSDLQTKILWSKLSYFGIAFLPVSYFLFTTAFSQKDHLLTNRNIFLLSIIPVITIGLILTNDSHHLVWTKVTPDPVENIAHYHHGPLFWFYWIYAQALTISGFFNLVHSMYKFTAYYKSQIGILIVASLFPLVANLMYVTNLNPFPGFDWTPVSFVITGLIVAFGIVRYRMFDLVPYARNKVIDTMDDGAMIINPEGFIEDCNEAACLIFNLSKKELIPSLFAEKLGKYLVLVDALNSKKTGNIHFETENKYYQVRISPIYYKNKNFSGNLLLIHDITTIKLAEDELKKSNKKLLEEIEKKEKLIEDLDSFAHTVAHDLKNSLGSIVSSSDAMTEIIQTDDTKYLMQLANLINKSAAKTMQITQELLILATVSHQEISKSQLDMNSIFNEAKLQLADNLNESKAKITEPVTWPVSLGYSPWIEEVWVNLLSNAIKYGGNPPEITVGAESIKNNKVKFWVKDNGNGLTEEEQKQLFKKYVRLAPKKVDGHGLGLSIVKRIVEKLDGSVGVESTTAAGEGCTFYFVLPVE